MILLKNGFIVSNNNLIKKDLLIDNGTITTIADEIKAVVNESIDITGKVILPGLTDVHVHLREPGYSYKETIKTGTMAAVKGGFTEIMAMPNLNPSPDSLDNLKVEEDIIEASAVAHVYPYGCVTIGEKGLKLADIKNLATHVKAISDDGVGVNNLALLRRACLLAKKYNLTIASHAEDNTYKTAREGEYLAVRREIEIAKATKCRYHFCHLSCIESFEAVKKAREEGYDNITFEVTPHHLFLSQEIINNNPNFKMNPPLRTIDDMIATREALLLGAADCIASDHAPHSEDEKSRPYEKCPNGIIGLETMLPLVYTYLVKTNLANWDDILRWFVINPSKIFNIPENKIKEGSSANLTVIDIENSHIYSKDEILSIGKNSPFIGTKLFGYSVLTVVDGIIRYRRDINEASNS